MAYTLPPLPYAFDALEPSIDAKTMEIHHDKHHQAYVTNLNAALEGLNLPDQPVEQLIANLACDTEPGGRILAIGDGQMDVLGDYDFS